MLGNVSIATTAGNVDGGQHELLLFGGREDFVEVDGNAEGDKEEPTDAGTEPVRGLKWGRRHELRVEGEGTVGGEDFGLIGREKFGGF